MDEKGRDWKLKRRKSPLAGGAASGNLLSRLKPHADEQVAIAAGHTIAIA
jgi:hypothetical protein